MINITKALFLIIISAIIAGCERPNIDIVTTKASPRLIDRSATEIAIGIDKNGNYWINKKRVPLDDLKRKLTAEYRPDFNTIAIRADKNARVSHLLLLTNLLDKNKYRYVLDVVLEEKHLSMIPFSCSTSGKKEIIKLTCNDRNKPVSLFIDGKEVNISPIKLQSFLKDLERNGAFLDSILLIEISGNASSQEFVDIIDPLRADNGIQVRALQPEKKP